MNIFFEMHSGLPREGPGSDESTKRAFSLLPGLYSNARILDAGCGPGRNASQLARLSGKRIIALDNHLAFLDAIQKMEKGSGLPAAVTPLRGSMFDLPFRHVAFDVIWAEGSIYIMGFENGIRSWKRHLKKNGCLAVTELSWFSPDAPPEAMTFWAEAYPGMLHEDENSALFASAGYREIARFRLPEIDWWKDYYTPLENRINTLRRKYESDPDALRQLDDEMKEIELFRAYSGFYGYVFYIMQNC